MNKLFVVRKYIYAKDAKHAIKLDKKAPVADIWVDDKWKENQETYKTIGFNLMACKKKKK